MNPQEYNQAGQPMQTSQTGAQGPAPIQVENVQYNMRVGTVRSKIGLITFLFAIGAWVISFVAIFLLTAIQVTISGGENIVLGTVIVFSIAVLVPVAPIFWYVRNRLNKVLVESPGLVDDLFFKRTIRLSLIIAIFIAVIRIIGFVYSLLSRLFLDGNSTWSSIINSFIAAVVFSGLALLFLQYQLKTKR